MDISSTILEVKKSLQRGDYSHSLDILESLSKKHSASSQVGAEIQLLMVTAFLGQGKDQKALDKCKLLEKVKDPSIREQAKQLISILEAPYLPRPENWSIKIPDLNFESSTFSVRKSTKKKKKTITYPPTGSTKALDFGFLLLLLIVLLLLTFYLSK